MLRIDGVHVEAEVQKRAAACVLERLAHARLDAALVDLAHREDLRLEPLQQVALSLVERPDAEERELPRLDRRQRPVVVVEHIAGQVERRRQHHPVDVSARRGLRRVQIAVRVDPDDAAGPVRLRHSDERSQRNRMVTAEHERCLTPQPRLLDELRDAVAQREDLRQEARRVIVDRERLRNRRLDVAEIVRHDAEGFRKMLRELRVANRRRAHVDAAPAGAEIERGADQSHVPLGRLRAHGRKANVPALADQPEAAAAPVRVLLADDDDSFLESLRPLIEHQADMTVVGTAENGLDAIELADELSPDAVVIDLHMPLVDGVTAVARLRKDHPNICLIALTGDPDQQLHQAVTEAGADAVLQKADLVDTLVDRLAAVRAPSG